MADFCKQCAEDMGWESDFLHLKDQFTEADIALGLGILVLCEGCGPIIIGHEGECVCPPHNDCLEHHGAKRKAELALSR